MVVHAAVGDHVTHRGEQGALAAAQRNCSGGVEGVVPQHELDLVFGVGFQQEGHFGRLPLHAGQRKKVLQSAPVANRFEVASLLEETEMKYRVAWVESISIG